MGIEIDYLVGKTATAIDGMKSDSDEVRFTLSDGTVLVMYHDQDCCERVSVDDVCGDVEDIIDTPILDAREETSSDTWPNDVPRSSYVDYYTWTFYILRTIKGTVTLRWFGESNGYYSEGVSLRFESGEA